MMMKAGGVPPCFGPRQGFFLPCDVRQRTGNRLVLAKPGNVSTAATFHMLTSIANIQISNRLETKLFKNKILHAVKWFQTIALWTLCGKLFKWLDSCPKCYNIYLRRWSFCWQLWLQEKIFMIFSVSMFHSSTKTQEKQFMCCVSCVSPVIYDPYPRP